MGRYTYRIGALRRVVSSASQVVAYAKPNSSVQICTTAWAQRLFQSSAPKGPLGMEVAGLS